MAEPIPAAANGGGHLKALPIGNDTEPDLHERSCLLSLVADLLYKNQILRFDLHSAREQLTRTAMERAEQDS